MIVAMIDCDLNLQRRPHLMVHYERVLVLHLFLGTANVMWLLNAAPGNLTVIASLSVGTYTESTFNILCVWVRLEDGNDHCDVGLKKKLTYRMRNRKCSYLEKRDNQMADVWSL